MKQLLTAVLLIAAFVSCHRQTYPYDTAIIEDGRTLIPMPDHNRDIGYDSIQLLVEDGKITANLCYPNSLRFKKDTVYTKDTLYRLWGFKVKLTPDMYITMRDSKHMMSMRHGYWDLTKPDWNCDSVIIDSFKITMQKVPYPYKE